jgi:phage gp36-like protein
MPYILKSDYNHLIQETNLLQLIDNDEAIRTRCENTAIKEMRSYLSARYDLEVEMVVPTIWVKATSYTGNQLVYLYASAYVPETTYSLNNLVEYDGDVYICIQAGQGKMGNASYWTVMGSMYSMFTAIPNADNFDYETQYEKDDEVFYKGKKYTATTDTINIFPDDEDYGDNYWGAGVADTFTGVNITDTDKWEAGDSRNSLLLDRVLDMTIYYMHKAIAPRNIPELRVKAYDDAIEWLKAAANGTVIAEMTYIQPRSSSSGLRTRFGYNQKNSNTY